MAEEHNLDPGKMIYTDISSQRKSSYGGSKNWVIIQDPDTKQKIVFLQKDKIKILLVKSPLSFLLTRSP